MMNRRTFIALLAAFLWCAPAHADEITGQEIMDRSLDQNALGFKSGEARLTLKINDKGGDQRVRSLDVKSKKFGELTRTLVVLTAPKDLKGQAFLFAEQTGEDDVWMFVPAFKVTRRVEGGQKNGAFLGSHFTFADLESRDMKDANYERLPDEKLASHEAYVVDATPKEGSKSDYTRVRVWIRKSDFIPLKAKFFGKGDALKKTLFIEKLDKTSDGTTYAKQMKLRQEGGGSTTITIDALRSDADIPDSTFTKEQLGK